MAIANAPEVRDSEGDAVTFYSLVYYKRLVYRVHHVNSDGTLTLTGYSTYPPVYSVKGEDVTLL